MEQFSRNLVDISSYVFVIQEKEINSSFKECQVAIK